MRILLPVDGSEISLEAVRFAVRLARKGLQVKAVLANVQEPATLYELLMVHDADAIDRICEQAGVNTLAPAQVLLEQAGISYEIEVVKGDPSHALADIVERFGCEMVIMGSRGMGHLRSALLGSVAHEMLHSAGVPVMIVKPDENVDISTLT